VVITDEERAERKERNRAIRAFIIFTLGAAAFIHEAFIVSTIRIEVIVASLAMMGLPAALKLDEIRRSGE